MSSSALGKLVVTDHWDTFQYLEHSGDEVYSPIDVETARAICRRHGVELDDRDPELYPQEMQVVRDQSLREAIDAVSTPSRVGSGVSSRDRSWLVPPVPSSDQERDVAGQPRHPRCARPRDAGLPIGDVRTRVGE